MRNSSANTLERTLGKRNTGAGAMVDMLKMMPRHRTSIDDSNVNLLERQIGIESIKEESS